MAEENKSGAAQFEIGKLFIDIGAKGLGGLLKGLTGLQAKFLLAKKSGEEFIKPFKSMSENASNAVVNYDKLHSVMGTALEDLQDYAKFAKLNNLDPSMFLNQVKNVQQQMYKIRAGLDTSGRKGLQILGIDPRDFDYNKPMQFIMTVMDKLKTVTPATRAQLLQMLNWSEEMAYFADRYNYYLDEQKVKLNDRLLLNKKEMKNLREQNDAWNVLKVTWESAQEKFISKQTWINKLLENTANWLNDTHPILEKFAKTFDNWANTRHPYLENLLTSLRWIMENFEKYLKIKDDLDISAQRQIIKEANNVGIMDAKSIFQASTSKDINVIRRLNQIRRAQSDLSGVNNSNDILPPLPNVAPSPMSFLPRSEQNDMSKNVEFTIINNNEINQNISGNDSGHIDEIGRATEGGLSKAQATQAYNLNQQFG